MSESYRVNKKRKLEEVCRTDQKTEDEFLDSTDEVVEVKETKTTNADCSMATKEKKSNALNDNNDNDDNNNNDNDNDNNDDDNNNNDDNDDNNKKKTQRELEDDEALNEILNQIIRKDEKDETRDLNATIGFKIQNNEDYTPDVIHIVKIESLTCSAADLRHIFTGPIVDFPPGATPTRSEEPWLDANDRWVEVQQMCTKKNSKNNNVITRSHFTLKELNKLHCVGILHIPM